MVVPASEVFALIQRTVCMIGNASEFISQTRRSKIQEAFDPSWSKYGTDDFPDAKEALFGNDFQSSLATKVEKDIALSKAVAIAKKSRNRKESPYPSDRRETQRNDSFFRRGPPARYGGRQGKNFFPYGQRPPRNREGQSSQRGRYLGHPRQGQRRLFHEPRLPPDQPQKTQQRKF